MTIREITRANKNCFFSIWNELDQYCEFAGDFEDLNGEEGHMIDQRIEAKTVEMIDNTLVITV